MISVRDLSVRYAGRLEKTLDGVDLRVRPGELVLLCGPTGCGKSTLLHCLNGILVHESGARVEGEILLDGRDARRMTLRDICRFTGSVFQNPESQICAPTVEAEVAFGLENLAIPRETMRERISEALRTTGLTAQRDRSTGALSGGEKQRLAIACALAVRPRALLLDEPVSQVDSESAVEILDVIARLKERHDCAVLLIEHRLDEAARLADRVVLMAQGRVVFDHPREAALADLEPLRSAGIALPHLPDLFERLGRKERPLSPEEAPLLTARGGAGAEKRVAPQPGEKGSAETICAVRNLGFRYSKTGPSALEGVDLVFRRGDRVALMGANGSGKTTLLHLLAGLLKPATGAVEWPLPKEGPADVGLVLQHPDLMLFQETVEEEVAFAPRQRRLKTAAREEICRDVLERLGLAELRREAPFALSRGQRVRAAVASVLSMRPRVLLLDEPTSGQDREQIERMMGALEEGFDLLVFCTHDADTAARHGNRVVMLSEGNVAGDGPPRQALFELETLARARIRQTGSQAYALRMGMRALTVEELAEALEGPP